MRSITTTHTVLSSLLLIVACGPKPAPKTAKDAVGEQALVSQKPKRQLSAVAKADFTKTVKRYQAAQKKGLVDCQSFAGTFADMYASYPKLVEAKFNEAVIWEQCGQAKKAGEIYQELLRRHPGHGPTLNNVGALKLAQGQKAEARSFFEKAAAQKNSEGYVNLAALQRKQALSGDTSALREAINNIHRALAVDSSNIEAYSLLATVLYDHAQTRSQLEMARLICVQASKKDADFAPVYNLLGLVLLKQGKVTPALAQFRLAAQKDPNFIEALMNIGAVTLSFRDYASAERSFSKVLSLNTVDARVKFAATVGLGVALRGQRRFDQALAQYQAAEKLDPGNGDIAYNMGILVQDYKFDASKPQVGIATLQKAVQMLNRYLSGGKTRKQRADAKRRIKNINEMIPMLREQQKMMQGSK